MRLLDLSIVVALLLALVAGGVALHDHGRKQGYDTGFWEGAATKTISTEHKRIKDLETQVKVIAAENAEHRCRIGILEKRCPGDEARERKCLEDEKYRDMEWRINLPTRTEIRAIAEHYRRNE